MSSGKKVFFAKTDALFHSYKYDTPANRDRPISASKIKSSSTQNIADSKTFIPPTPRSIMKKTNLRRSRSAVSIATPRKDLVAESPIKTSPVTHYCSPRTARRRLNVAESSAGKNKPIPSTPECFSKVHLETPAKSRSPSNPLLSEESSHLSVGVRVRPLNNREESESGISKIVRTEGNEISVLCESNSCHNFTYDHVFSPTDSQEIIFSSFVQPLLENAFRGYNACLFAYGQTGSGKSYSMMGINSDSQTVNDEAGIIPRFCHELFERVASLEDSHVPGVQEKCSAKIEISYFEIYNEKIHDLLNNGESSGKRGNALKIREHPVFGPYVVDLTVHEVSSFEDVQNFLSIGSCQRASASTAMNEESSRSHSIFSIILTQRQFEDSGLEGVQNELSRCSKISLVDLAGSERVAQSCASLDRLREGVHINKSLLTLGKVITALAEAGCSKRKIFIPYRDSVLTWLLRESLGGNSRTSMLATISPANVHLEETLATLRYACQAKNIVNTVRVNEDPKDRIIRELRGELQKYKTSTASDSHSNDSLKVRLLQEKLSSSERKLAQLEKCYDELERLKDLEGVRRLDDDFEDKRKGDKEIVDLKKIVKDQEEEIKRLQKEMDRPTEEIERQKRELEELKLDIEEQNNFMEEQRIENEELRMEMNEQRREMEDRLQDVKRQQKELEDLKSDLEERAFSLEEQQRDLDEQQRDLDEQRDQIEDHKKEIEERKMEMEEKYACMEEQRKEIEEIRFQVEEQKLKMEEQSNKLEAGELRLKEQEKDLREQRMEFITQGTEKEKLRNDLSDLYGELEEQRKTIEEQRRNIRDMKNEHENLLQKKLDELRREMESKHKTELKKKLEEQKKELNGNKEQSEIFMRKYEEKVEEIEEIKLSSQIELWKKLELQKEEVLKTREKYEAEISQRNEEQKKEIENVRQKYQTDLSRKLEEQREQLKRTNEMDFSRKLEDGRLKFEQELKRMSLALEAECSRAELCRKDMKKLEKQIQFLQVDLDSKTKLVKELSRMEDEGFEDFYFQPNDYESFTKEIIQKFEKINSVVINFANDVCEDLPSEDKSKVPFEKTSMNLDKAWLENINLKTSRRSSIPACVSKSPTRVSIRTLPTKKTVRFQDISSL